MTDSLKISVVVIAFNRAKYLRGAIDSVLNQTLGREQYEIVVVKNFKDTELDLYLQLNNVTNILRTEGTNVGANYTAGILNSSGDVVAFLDDDDLYLPDKLKEIYNSFSANRQLIYLYNNIAAIDECGAEIPNYDPRLIPFGKKIRWIHEHSVKGSSEIWQKIAVAKRLEAFWAPSCTAIRRDVLENSLSSLETLEAAPGIFLLCLAAENTGDLLFSPKKLTRYRIHSSLSHLDTSDYLDFKTQAKSFWKKSYSSLTNIISCFKSKEVTNFISLLSYISLAYYYMFSNTTLTRRLNVFIGFRYLYRSSKVLRLEEKLAIAGLLFLSVCAPKRLLQQLFWTLSKRTTQAGDK